MIDAVGLFVLGVAALAISVVEPAWGLLLLFASTFVDVQTDLGGGLTVFSSEAVFAIVFAVWLVSRGRGFLCDRAQRPLLAGTAVFLLVLLLSGVLSDARGDAIKGFVRWVEFLGVLVMASDAGRRGALSRRVVLGALAIAVLVLAAHGLWDARPWLVRVDAVLDRVLLRLPGGSVVWRVGGFVHPNAFAAVVFPCAALCAAAWVALPVTALSVAAFAAAVLGGAAVVLTYSRAGLLAYTIAMAAVLASCFAAPDSRRRLVRLGLLAVVTVLAVRSLSAPAALAEQFATVRATADKMVRMAGGNAEGKRLKADMGSSQVDMAIGTLDDRKLMAETAGRLVRQSPWLGTGPGGWRRHAPEYAPAGMDATGLVHHPHNLYLLVMVESGILGLVSFVLLFVALFWRVPWTFAWPEAAFRFGWAGILAGFLVMSAFEVPLVLARGMGLAFLLGFLRWPFSGRKLA